MTPVPRVIFGVKIFMVSAINYIDLLIIYIACTYTVNGLLSPELCEFLRGNPWFFPSSWCSLPIVYSTASKVVQRYVWCSNQVAKHFAGSWNILGHYRQHKYEMAWQSWWLLSWLKGEKRSWKDIVEAFSSPGLQWHSQDHRERPCTVYWCKQPEARG